MRPTRKLAMSNFRVCKMKIGKSEFIEARKFDDKQDAEHFAKNQSLSDSAHGYEIQKIEGGAFVTIKAYLNGEVTQKLVSTKG